MTDRFDYNMIAEAIDWHIKLRDGTSEDWESFTLWLEEDPAHNAAYEHVADHDAVAGTLLGEAEFTSRMQIAEQNVLGGAVADLAAPDIGTTNNADPANDASAADNARPARTYRWAWASIAASLVVGFLFISQLLPGLSNYEVETQPGQLQTIALEDGSEMMLNGGTKVALTRSDPRTVELLSGEAHFRVEHDDGNPFIVIAGERRLVDLGTVFNVTMTGNSLELEVADGAVRYESKSNEIELKAGEGLTVDASNTITVYNKSTDAMSGWTQGMLIYENATLGNIGADLSRATGMPVEFSPELEQRQFSGVIQTDGSNEEIRSRVEQLLGLTVTPDEDSWTITP